MSERVGFDIRNLNRLSRLCYRFSHLLASIDSLTSFSPLANNPLGHHSDHSPFAQWSPETLGAGLILPFALTNSPHFRLRRTAHCADIRLVCHVGTWVRIPPAHFAKNENTPFGVFHFWRNGQTKGVTPRWGVPKASDLRLLARNKYRRRSKAAVRRLSERVDPTQLRTQLEKHLQ